MAPRGTGRGTGARGRGTSRGGGSNRGGAAATFMPVTPDGTAADDGDDDTPQRTANSMLSDEQRNALTQQLEKRKFMRLTGTRDSDGSSAAEGGSSDDGGSGSGSLLRARTVSERLEHVFVYAHVHHFFFSSLVDVNTTCAYILRALFLRLQ